MFCTSFEFKKAWLQKQHSWRGLPLLYCHVTWASLCLMSWWTEEKRKCALHLLLPSEVKRVQQDVWGRLVSGGFLEKQQILLKSTNILDQYSCPTLSLRPVRQVACSPVLQFYLFQEHKLLPCLRSWATTGYRNTQILTSEVKTFYF